MRDGWTGCLRPSGRRPDSSRPGPQAADLQRSVPPRALTSRRGWSDPSDGRHASSVLERVGKRPPRVRSEAGWSSLRKKRKALKEKEAAQ